LRWAGGTGSADCNADIVTISFGLGNCDIPQIRREIDNLVGKRKLIFAAASNGGGNGTRAYPARNDGVFAIHATKGLGERSRLSPPRLKGSAFDNFATLGEAIDSRWKDSDITISGTSFATPVAAAIAANVLEFSRRALIANDDHPEFFDSYQGMGTLFRCLKDKVDGYDYLKPWRPGFWEELRSRGQFLAVCDNLRHVIKYGRRMDEVSR
jgi:hypothetical protein